MPTVEQSQSKSAKSPGNRVRDPVTSKSLSSQNCIFIAQICKVAFMFGRAAGQPLACLRCHTRLAHRNRIQDRSNVLSSLPDGLRWHSAVALRIDNEEPDTPSSTNQDLYNPGQDGATGIRVPEKVALNEERPRARTKFRRFRPHNAEKLGVDVLGKPAEILILPSRERQTTSVAPDQLEKSGRKAEVQQSLDSELKPIVLQDVLKNIDSVRDEHGNDKREFSASEWQKIETHLARGFTRSQLLEYLRKSEETIHATHEKQVIAAKIMTGVWKWKSQDVEDTRKHVKEVTVVMGPVKLNYIMRHENQHLDTLSETYDVQINVYKNSGRIKVSGPTSGVQKVCDELNLLKQRIRVHALGLPGPLHGFILDDARSKDLLHSLMQEHKLFIYAHTKTQHALKIAGTSDAASDWVLRDLVLASDTLRKATAFSIFSAEEKEQMTPIPMNSDQLPRWTQSAIDWCRYVSTRISNIPDLDQLVTTRTRNLRSLVRKILKTEKPDRDKLSLFKTAHRSVIHEYFAEMGQALFRSRVLAHPQQKPLEEESSISELALILQQALLPQVFARKDFLPWKDRKEVQTSSPATNGRPMLLRLRLQPCTSSDICPVIEVFLSGIDASLGLRQKLKIERVYAILDQWQHTLLLPQEPLDILMVRQSKIDLLGVNDGEPPKAYLNVLRQLASYLEKAQSLTEVELPPIWRLDTSSLLASNALARARLDTSEATTMYILESPEFLNITAYTSTFGGDNFIDHVISTTDAIDRPRQKQSVRVSSDSLINLLRDRSHITIKTTHDIVEKHRLFTKSMTCAYQFATTLSDAAKAVDYLKKATKPTNDVL